MNPSGVQLGNGTRMVGTQKVFTNGNLQTTGQSLDVAIDRQWLPAGAPCRTANRPTPAPASCRSTPNGMLVNAQGLPLVPQITMPTNATAITIGENGIVSRPRLPGHAAPTELGQLTLTTFINPAGLQALGENLFQETAASGAPTEGRAGDGAFGKLKQGALEGSNVQVVEEMVDMIAAQRTYEMNTKVLSAADNMLQYLAQAAR